MSDLADTVPPPPKPSHTPHLLIFLTVLIDLIGFGIVIPVLPQYAKNFNASPVDNGWLMAIYSLMQVIFSPLWGKLSDRVGRRPVLLISSLGTAIGFYMMGAAGGLITLFVARMIDGISGGNIGTAQAYLADITAPEKRAKMMGLIGAAFGLGFMIGPILGGLAGLIHHSAPFIVAGTLALVNTIFIYFKLPESLKKEDRVKTAEKSSVLNLLKGGSPVLRRVLLANFVIITAFSIFTARYSLDTTKSLGLEGEEFHKKAAFINGMLFGMVGLVGAVIQGKYIGRLVQKFGEKPLALVGVSLMALFFFALQGSGALWSIALVSIGIAVGNSLVTPTLSSIASRSADASTQGRTMGLMGSAGSMGRVIGPILSGYIAHLLPYWWAGAFMLVALVVIFMLNRAQPAAMVDAPKPEEVLSDPSI